MKLFGYEITKARNELSIPEHVSGSVYLDSLGGIAYSMRSRTIRSDYENAFAPVSAIVDEVIKRKVHLAQATNPDNDITGAQPIWSALMRPNDAMGWIDFLGVLISGFMALPELSLLLWHSDGTKAHPGCPEGGFKLNTIAGFTVLPKGSRYTDGTGRECWRVTTRQGQRTFDRHSVVTLKYSILPDDGITGVSPGSSSHQEASIRDALNQYERGFFTNGAKPSIIVTIHASSNEEFEAIRNSYEAANRGPGKQGGAIYQKIIDNPIAGMMAGPSIEITPVGAVNDSLAINDIVSFTSQTINANYGVSPIIFGDASTTTYQNQQIVDRKFMARVQSVLVRLFSGFERELERITKAPLPFVFAWDSTDIELTDELKVKADIKVSTVNALKELVGLGADPDKAVEALGLGDEWKGLGLTNSSLPPSSGNANALAIRTLIQLGADSDAAARALGMDANWMGLNLQAPTLEETEAPTEPAASGAPAPSTNATTGRRKRVADRQVELVGKVRNLLLDIAQHRLDYATGKFAAALMPTEAAYVDEMLEVLQELADAGGATTARQLAQEIKDYKVGTDYTMSAEAFALISARAVEVVNHYSELLDTEIAKLRGLDPDGWPKSFETSVAAGLIGARIEAVTIGETKNAFQTGQLDNAINIQNEWRGEMPNASIIKTWHATGPNPCEFCSSVDGTPAGIQDTFVPDGILQGHDGKTLILDTDYSDGTLPDAHVNCQCTFGFTVKVGS